MLFGQAQSSTIPAFHSVGLSVAVEEHDVTLSCQAMLSDLSPLQ